MRKKSNISVLSALNLLSRDMVKNTFLCVKPVVTVSSGAKHSSADNVHVFQQEHASCFLLALHFAEYINKSNDIKQITTLNRHWVRERHASQLYVELILEAA